MSKRLREIVKEIQFRKDFTIEEVAKSVGYTRVHLTKEMQKEESPILEKALIEKYSDILQNVSRETTKNPDISPGVTSEVALLKQIIELKDQIIGMQSKENNSLQDTVNALTKRVEGIDARVQNCNQLIQESNHLSIESNRLAKEGNEFLKQLEGLAELAKSERLQEAANLQPPYTKKKDGRGSPSKSR